MAVDHDVLIEHLTRLQLTCIRDQLDSLLDEAGEKQLTLREAVAFLVGREVSRKNERRLEMAMKIAHFPTVRELAEFDFKAQPSVDKRQIQDLAAARWVAHGDAVLLLGPPGVGKSHLAIALGRETIRQGYSVRFATAQAVMASLVKVHSEDNLDPRLAFYAKPKLSIVDELGYLPFERHAAHLFFQLVARRYERGSMLITSNRSVGEWGEVFGDAVVATGSSTACCTTATCSRSPARATGCARSAAPACWAHPPRRWRRRRRERGRVPGRRPGVPLQVR